MPTPTETVCQSCRKPITIDYIRLGVAVTCPHCLKRTVPEVPVGCAYPKSGYQLTYRDFRQLLENPSYRTAVAPFVAEWFGFRIEQAGADTVVRGADQVPVDLLWLHEQIQSDPHRQARLYREAMTLWR